ncbi:MAG: DEAD-box type RNA helicase [Alyxoria varia]|nr:MAG: DEAD-box type RNA helicase [Alyxoria varia]
MFSPETKTLVSADSASPSSDMDVVQAIEKLKALPPELHLFCPRQDVIDTRVYLPEDLQGNDSASSEQSRAHLQERIDAAQSRKSMFLDSLRIFAFDGPDARPFQEYLEKRIDVQMSQCDVCVRQFHRGRRDLQQMLEEQRNYDEDEVAPFLDRFDALNAKRIKKHLSRATVKLRQCKAEHRNFQALNGEELYSIFETISSPMILKDEAFLAQHFDEPFRLVQTNKKLKLATYPPALGYFIFQNNRERVSWAHWCLQRVKRCILDTEFVFSFREPLESAMSRIQLDNLDAGFLPKFWAGARAIVSKLDRHGITHCLRAMDGDVCRLALDHMQINSAAFKDLLAVVNFILKISPTDFWEAMSATPPNIWIEQFFNSPALYRLAGSISDDRSQTHVLLEDLFSWIVPFLASIKPVNRISACRGFADQLLGTYQDGRYASVTRSYCFNVAMRCLSDTARILRAERMTIERRGPCKDMLSVVAKHARAISSHAMPGSEHVSLGAEVFEQALALDVHCLLADRLFLTTNESISQTPPSFHQAIWMQVDRTVVSDNFAMAKAALCAVQELIGLEKFPIRSSATSNQSDLIRFNEAFDGLNRFVTAFSERVIDFDPSCIQKIFDDPVTVDPFMSLLSSSDSQVRSAAVDIIKTVSGKSVRKEAIGDALKTYFDVMVNGYSRSLLRISQKKTFASASSFIKFCKDVLDILCNTSNGVLKTTNLTPAGAKATEALWHAMWQELATIFTTTEHWSSQGHDRQIMSEFCRDVMEFAENVFDQFPVFASALKESSESGSSSRPAGKRLTNQPRTTMDSMVKWLRLKDDYLLSKSTTLICDILKRLKHHETKVADSTLQYIEEVITEKIKSVLTSTQRANLYSALETHTGSVFVLDDKETSRNWHKREQRDNSESSLGGPIDLTGSRTIASSASAKGIAKRAEPAKVQPAVRPAPNQAQKPQAVQGANRVPAKPQGPAKSTASWVRERQEAIAARKKRDAEASVAMRQRLAAQDPSSIEGQTAQQGSGLKGLGVAGKDHSRKKRSEIMVSSDESSSEDEGDAIDRELFGISEMKEASGNNKENANRKVSRQGPVRKQRVQRSARDMRARIQPDLSPLHKTVLSWDYNHDGEFPPNGSGNYATVLSTFRHPGEYKNTFQPLLQLEAWNGFLKAREENNSRVYRAKVGSRSTVDAFVEVSATIEHKDIKEAAEGDLVVLSQSGRLQDPDHCLGRIVKINRLKTHNEVVYRVTTQNNLLSLLKANTMIECLRIMAMIPLEREYAALLGLEYYDLCDEIIRAKPSPLLDYGEHTLNPLIKNYDINRAQAKAIKSALDNDAFTLVQGPPGSGKTKTIVATVGALLSETLRHQPQPRPPTSDTPMRKLLVCAPSNAAVDELVMRFKHGVKTLRGEHRNVSILRVGRSDAINAAVQDVTLDELINKRMNAGGQAQARETTQAIMKEHQAISEKLREARDKKEPNQKDVDFLRQKKAELSHKIDEAKDNEGYQGRQFEIHRKQIQASIVNDAQVICATLSGSGSDLLSNINVEFDSVVIDEAAQCVELSALIPLKYGCAKCILVGDPQQLPPTVFSREAANFKYEQSLFVRMQERHPDAVNLLDTQYRMHPEISIFPSRAFYDSRLLDGENMAALRTRPWHAAELLGPFRFFDVQGQHKSAPSGHSLVNHAEVRVAIQLYERLISDFASLSFENKVGIITPYKSQLKELREQFSRRFGRVVFESIEFNTTDAFQGRESEIIIFSCVRASPTGGSIGFLQDIRRMNVGLTRAKSSLWVLGNSQSLVRGKYWKMLVDHAHESDRYTTGVEEVLRRPSKTIKDVEVSMSDAPAQEDVTVGVPAFRLQSERTSDGANGAKVATPRDRNGVSARPNLAGQIPQSTASSRTPSAAAPAKRKHSEDTTMRDGSDTPGPNAPLTNPHKPRPKPDSGENSDSDVVMMDSPDVATGSDNGKAKRQQSAVKKEPKKESAEDIRKRVFMNMGGGMKKPKA